jgi:hypothetical protein
VYFSEKGANNTEETINLAYERAVELEINDIVVASTHGNTALKVAKIFADPTFNIIAISISEAYDDQNMTMTPKEKARLTSKDIKVFTGICLLDGDVNTAFRETFHSISINEVVGRTLYAFCQGMKVCIEIALMAADAGLIPIDREVIAIGGTHQGADTAIVVKPSYPRKFLRLKVTEIIAKPREG